MTQNVPITQPNPHDDRSPTVLCTLWILIGFAIVVLAARIWSKILKTNRLYWDDGLMILAFILGLIYTALTTVAVHYGLGRHFLDLSEYQQQHAIYFGILSLAWGNLSPMVGRIAFCVTMLFLTKTDPRVKKWPIWFFITGQILFNTAAVTFFYAQCGRRSMMSTSQNHAVQNQCLNPIYQTYFGYFVGSFNCLTDAFLTVLPAILINHTRLSLKKQIGLAFLLCLSMLALLAAIGKTYEAKALSEPSDYTYDLCMYVVCLSVELNVVIIVSSIPLLRPLFHRKAQQYRAEPVMKWDTITLPSVFSKKGMRSSTTRYSLSSQDNIITPQELYELPALPSIHVTREVSVTFQPNDVPFVHAALVGLIQGEIANPRLVQR